MKKYKKRLLFGVFLILLTFYIVMTLPRNFFKKNQPVIGIRISYIENIMSHKNGILQSYLLENEEDIKNIIDILDNYRYRYYLSKQNFTFTKSTSEIIINIIYNEEVYDTIHIYSDGSILVNYKTAHIGFIGTKQSRSLFNSLYKEYLDK